LAAGLREGDGGYHLITFKPDPAPHPAGFLHDEPWLDFSVMQTWKWVERIYPMVTQEYHLKPVKRRRSAAFRIRESERFQPLQTGKTRC
jgi:hypothetical protein